MDPDAARAPAGADAAAAEKEETLRRLESEVALWGSACSTSDAMIGRWVDELGMVEVALARGAFRDTIGVQKGSQLFLFPEEAAFLAERGGLVLLALRPSKTPGKGLTLRLMSLQDIHALADAAGVPAAVRIVYARLANAGWLVRRHGSRWSMPAAQPNGAMFHVAAPRARTDADRGAAAAATRPQGADTAPDAEGPPAKRRRLGSRDAQAALAQAGRPPHDGRPVPPLPPDRPARRSAPSDGRREWWPAEPAAVHSGDAPWAIPGVIVAPSPAVAHLDAVLPRPFASRTASAEDSACRCGAGPDPRAFRPGPRVHFDLYQKQGEKVSRKRQDAGRGAPPASFVVVVDAGAPVLDARCVRDLEARHPGGVLRLAVVQAGTLTCHTVRTRASGPPAFR